MALVSNVPSLSNSFARRLATVDNARPFEFSKASTRRVNRRLSTGSSSTEVLESSLESSGTTLTNTNSSSNTSADLELAKPAKKNRLLPDVILHVENCAIAVHFHVIKKNCRVLHEFLQRLKSRNAVGELASFEHSQSEPSSFSSDQQSFDATRNQFSLRHTKPLNARSAKKKRQTKCPLQPRQKLLTDRSTPRKKTPRRLARFSKVCCLAHENWDSQETRRTPARLQHSPGKENCNTLLASTSTVRPRPLSRIAQAPQMPFLEAFSTPRKSTNLRSTPSLAELSLPVTPSQPPPPRIAPDALHVELTGATADAAATLVQYFYTGFTTGVNTSNAAILIGLCNWFCMEDRLLYAALACRAKTVEKVSEWMDVLLSCTTLRSERYANILINSLLHRIKRIPEKHFQHVLRHMPFQRLAAIEDSDVLTKVLVLFVNHFRKIEIWRDLAFALELWLHWTFNRPFTSLDQRKAMSLLEFHNKYVSWDPVVHIDNHDVLGVDAYVTATTLFSFGPFVFQVRFEPDSNPLILWRVIRAGSLTDPSEADTPPSKSDLKPPFSVRGRLSLVYRLSATSPMLHEDVTVRYTHGKETYGKWHVLLAAPSEHARHVSIEPEAEEKTQEPHEEPSRHTSIHSSQVFEPMFARFSGQCFVWGHKLCNLYHYLLVSTMFYQVATDAPLKLRIDATVQRMRELPVDSLVHVLQCDRLRIPGGESTLANALDRLCFSDYGKSHLSVEQIQQLLNCVRWCFVDLEQIMTVLEHACKRPELKTSIYELIEEQLIVSGNDVGIPCNSPRRAPWGAAEEPIAPYYHAATTLVEFQIEAGDRSLSPSKLSLLLE